MKKIWILGSLALNIGLIGCSNPEVEALENDVAELEEENAALEEQSPAAVEQRQAEIEEVSRQYVEVVYTEDQEQYEELMAEAEPLMTENIHQYLFPSETYRQDEIVAEVRNPQIFIEAGNVGVDEATVLTRFVQRTTDTTSDEEEETTNFLELHLIKEEDKWIVDNFAHAADEMQIQYE